MSTERTKKKEEEFGRKTIGTN